MSVFEIKTGYTERAEPAYFLDDPKGVLYQPDVYWYAFGVAVEIRATGVVDVGCGYAPKLAALHDHRPDWRYLGVDHGPNIEHCARAYDWGEWLTVDLDQPHTYDAKGAVIVCADAIEHLVDPAFLLDGIRTSGCVAAVISTPERDLTWGTEHAGPPPNPCHVREWNLPEFGDYLELAGFRIDHLGLTRSDDAGTGEKTILARVS